jgi:hypothetical protein
LKELVLEDRDRTFYRCPSQSCKGFISTELDEKKDLIAICDDCGISYDIAYLDGWHDHEDIMYPNSKKG